MGQRRLLELSGAMVSAEKQAGARAADPMDAVPATPDHYRLTDPRALGGTETWTASDIRGLRHMAHAQGLSHRQTDGLQRWGAFVGPQIARDGTAALSDHLWTAFGHQARALGLTAEQAKAFSDVLDAWAQRIDRLHADEAARRRRPWDIPDTAPGHVRR